MKFRIREVFLKEKLKIRGLNRKKKKFDYVRRPSQQRERTRVRRLAGRLTSTSCKKPRERSAYLTIRRSRFHHARMNGSDVFSL